MFNSSNSGADYPTVSYKNYTNSREDSSSETCSYSSNDDFDVKIPKIIMQTWIDNDIPKKWKCSPESIKKVMPDWEYVLMTDTDNRKFVKKHFPSFLKYYDRFPHNIQKADANWENLQKN